MGKIVVTSVLALVFGFLGAATATTVFPAAFQGEQGQTGLAGAPGKDGADGEDGAVGPTGPAGPAGKAGKAGRAAQAAAEKPLNIGSSGCIGKSVRVITDISISPDQKLRLTRENVCVVP